MFIVLRKKNSFSFAPIFCRSCCASCDHLHGRSTPRAPRRSPCTTTAEAATNGLPVRHRHSGAEQHGGELLEIILGECARQPAAAQPSRGWPVFRLMRRAAVSGLQAYGRGAASGAASGSPTVMARRDLQTSLGRRRLTDRGPETVSLAVVCAEGQEVGGWSVSRMAVPGPEGLGDQCR